MGKNLFVYLLVLANLICLITSKLATLNLNNISDPNSVKIHFMDIKHKQVLTKKKKPSIQISINYKLIN